MGKQIEYLQHQLTQLHLEKLLGPEAAVDLADPQGLLRKLADICCGGCIYFNVCERMIDIKIVCSWIIKILYREVMYDDERGSKNRNKIGQLYMDMMKIKDYQAEKEE